MRRKRLFSLLAILSLLISLTVVVPIVHGQGPDDFDAPEKQEQQYPNLGSYLNQLVASVESGDLTDQDAASDSPIYSGGSVAVTIYLSSNVDGVVEFLEDNGGDPRNTGEDYIEAYVPVSLLGQLSQQPGVIRVREIVPAQDTFGNITSQGVAHHRSPAWHTAGYDGQGVKVGVVDGNFDFKGYSSLIGTELTAPAAARCYTDVGQFTNNLADCEGGDNPNDDYNHGTALAEIVIDIAPEATLYLGSPLSPGDYRATIDWMVEQGVQVIAHSEGTFFDGPGDGTSPFSNSRLRTVDAAVEGGIIYVNAAGNSGSAGWFIQEPYTDSDGDGFIEFAPGDEINAIIVSEENSGRKITAQLRWKDTWLGASSDFDLYLARWDATSQQWITVAKSEDLQAGGSDHIPHEAVAYTTPAAGIYGLAVEHYSGNVPDWIQLLVWGSSIQHYTGYGSVGNPGESANPGMLTVGAARYWDTNTIASYSSRGPTPDSRIKPDIVGTDCVDTFSYGTDRGFCGTSAAAPHVAGLAALVKQRFPTYTPAQIASYLKHYADPRHAPDPYDSDSTDDINNTWGHGFARLPAPDASPPPLSDICGDTIAADGAVSGTWAAGCDSAVSGRGHAHYYTFTLTQQSDVTIDLESSIDTFLYLREGEAKSGTALHENDDIVSGNTNSRITATLAAGTYTIEATTYDPGKTGSFTLTVSGLSGGGGTPPSDNCTSEITADGAISGTWAAGCDSAVSGRGHARYYTITLAQASDVTISLESSIDTYLYLRQGEANSGTALHENDDIVSGNTNSRIQETLAAGKYTIEATTYDTGKTGSFTLTVSGLAGGGGGTPPTDTCGETITADGTTNGTWAAGCDSAVAERGHARYYTFTLAQASDVTISLESSIDTYLYLRDGEARSGAFRMENDDIVSGNTNSRIQATALPAGKYTIEATTYDTGKTGSFILTVSGLGGGGGTPPSDTCGETLTGDGTTNGTWAAGCDSAVSGRGHARYYTFTLAQAGGRDRRPGIQYRHLPLPAGWGGPLWRIPPGERRHRIGQHQLADSGNRFARRNLHHRGDDLRHRQDRQLYLDGQRAGRRWRHSAYRHMR